MQGWNWRRAIAPLVLAAALLAGCSFGGGNDTTQNTEPLSLKVMYYDERSFYSQYGMLFAALYPNIELEVVSTQNVTYEEGKDMNKAMMDFIDEEQPDLLMLSTDQYTKMAEEGRLYELDTFVQDEAFNVDGLVPGLVEYMRELSGGKLYGLPTDYYSQALFYNKDLFDRYGIPLPEDRMSWTDLLQLAGRFPTDGGEDRVYGLNLGYNSDLFSLGTMIGNAQNLSLVNPSTKQVTIDTDAWRQVFDSALRALQSNTLYIENPERSSGPQSYEDYLLSNPFIGGKAAMTIESPYFLDQIKQAQENAAVKDKAVNNWDLVTVPVDPQNPDYSTGVSLGQLFAINGQSPNTDAAWKFLSYISGDEFARVTSKVNNGRLPIRSAYLQDAEGHRMEVFYSLKPAQSSLYKNYDQLPQTFFMQFMGLAQQELQAAVDEQKPLADVLAELQTKGQEVLLQAEQEEENAPATSDSGGGTVSSGSVSVSVDTPVAE